jgi:molybdopterin-containing oxidoreductase family iron-sulfur binding subunit
LKEIDFKEFRQRIGDLRGKEYWRSLEELSRTEAFDEFFAQEFPQQALALEKGVDRRSFMKLMGASVALGGLAACSGPAEKIVPYINQPENLVPGKPLFFASAMTLGGFGTGVLVESHMGRPTKIEGNPDHPSSLGATDSFMQAAILGLYDPDRSQVVRHLGEISTWSDFLASLQPTLKIAASQPGAVRLLTQTVSSPTLGSQIQQVLAKYPGVQWHQWEPVSRDNVREGLRMAFGGYANAVYHFDKANVVVSLDADFLDDGPGHLRYARDFADRRRVRHGATKAINRLYAIESSPGGSGAIADHRFPVRSSEVETWARNILGALGGAQGGSAEIAAIAKDLLANRGASIVIAGEGQPAAVHAVAMAINTMLGNIGTTVSITDPVEVAPVNQLESMRKLVTDMNAGAVKALIMIGGNPAFDAPSDFNFAQALVKVPFRVHQSLYYDETGMLCHWHIPETHFLEAWSDVRGHDGTISIVQPLIAPLYNGRSAHEMLGALLGGMDVSAYDAVRNQYAQNVEATALERVWRKWLNDGLIAGSAFPQRPAAAAAAPPPPAAHPAAGFEVQLRHDATIYDGRFANNAWLQELPKPQTKITWDNVLLISPNTAREKGYSDAIREGLVNERRTVRATLAYRGRVLDVPVWVVPGHPDNCGTLTFGYGRTHGGKIANGTGVNAYPLRFSDALNGGVGADLTLRVRDKAYPIGCTQEHQSMNPQDVGGERGIIRAATFTEYQHDPHFAHEGSAEEEKESMYPPFAYKNHAWAMVIDTSVCTGCNGCVVACVAENNIAVVGKDEVVREREMHWLRIDRYYRGPADNPTVYHQPVPCMHCENAPCEPVCPVEATSHSGDGLNDMTYNRCVGTRYCSNNCPYKVRRFNFFHYSSGFPYDSNYGSQAMKAMRNPDVTVRTRGVMEKCTYCVQRINAAKIEAEKRGGDERVRDGEVTTACAQACPTQAIVFGDMNDPNSRVHKLKEEPTNYALLAELNTRPRTTYLATIKNPNPEIKE